MTTYSKRDIRAVDMLAMILVGFGFVLLLYAAWPWLAGLAGGDVATAKSGKPVARGPGSWLIAIVFLALGTALALKVRQLTRTQGREPDDYPGVPD